MTKTVEECRLCLTKIKPKNLTSLFQSASSILYSDMVKEIANVMISQDDDLPDKFCHTCRRKVKELYDFKQLIESSDKSLRGSLYPKKISFSNISDVKLDICPVKSEINSYEHFSEKLEFDDKENLRYNDIVITKLQPSKVKVESNLLLIDEFLDSINDDYGDEDQYTGHTVYDEAIETDYGPSSNDEEDQESSLEDLEDLPIAMRKIIKQNQERARRLELRRQREEEAEDEDWNLPPHAQQKSGEKKKKIKYPKDLDHVKRVTHRINFKPPLTKVNLKPEVWTNLRLMPHITTRRRRKVRSTLCPHCGLEPKNLKTHLKSHTVRFVPPLIKTVLKPENWTHLKMIPQIHNRKRKQRASLCPHCGLEPTNLENHLKTHSAVKQFHCELCPNRAYYTKGGLRAHMVKHEGGRKYQCQKCTASFFTVGSLNNHQKSHGERTFKCRHCDKMYKWRAGWLRHEKSHNAANKNVMCDMCNMSFFTKGGLRHHMRIHTGERPFKCEICNQPYSYKHDFNRHCMNKHGVFLKRRDVRVMNEEVLAVEREITKGLVLRAHGILQEGEPQNPFEKDGARGAMAFTQFLKDVERGKVPIQLDLQDTQMEDT